MNFLGHLRTINHHKKLVMIHCFRCGMIRQGLLHDLSKYSPTEFWVGVRYYQGYRSPNNAEREARGYSSAWLHHKGRNKHHLEYWIDYPIHGGTALVGCEMPKRYVFEMFCDRVAASKTYDKEAYNDTHPWDYYSRSHDHYVMHENSRTLLEQLLIMLRDQGEDATFAYMKSQYRLWKKEQRQRQNDVLS